MQLIINKYFCIALILRKNCLGLSSAQLHHLRISLSGEIYILAAVIPAKLQLFFKILCLEQYSNQL